jgi:hypothetical protein
MGFRSQVARHVPKPVKGKWLAFPRRVLRLCQMRQQKERPAAQGGLQQVAAVETVARHENPVAGICAATNVCFWRKCKPEREGRRSLAIALGRHAKAMPPVWPSRRLRPGHGVTR